MTTISRHQWIAEAAYFKAEARNFLSGKALDDWLEAEKDYIKMAIAYYLQLAEENGETSIAGLQQLAQAAGVHEPEKIHLKIELIQAIQQATHHQPCFRDKLNPICQENACEWKAECRKLIADWCR